MVDPSTEFPVFAALRIAPTSAWITCGRVILSFSQQLSVPDGVPFMTYL